MPLVHVYACTCVCLLHACMCVCVCVLDSACVSAHCGCVYLCAGTCVCVRGHVCVCAHSLCDCLVCERMYVRVGARVWHVHVSVCCHGMLSHHLVCVGLCAPVRLSQCGPLGRYELHTSALSVCRMCLATSINVCCRVWGASVPAEPSSPPSCPQGCCPKAWSSALPLTTTRCAKVTTPPSGMGAQKVSHISRGAVSGTDSGPQHPHLSDGWRSGQHHVGLLRGFRGLHTPSLETTALWPLSEAEPGLCPQPLPLPVAGPCLPQSLSPPSGSLSPIFLHLCVPLPECLSSFGESLAHDNHCMTVSYCSMCTWAHYFPSLRLRLPTCKAARSPLLHRVQWALEM